MSSRATNNKRKNKEQEKSKKKVREEPEYDSEEEDEDFDEEESQDYDQEEEEEEPSEDVRRQKSKSSKNHAVEEKKKQRDPRDKQKRQEERDRKKKIERRFFENEAEQASDIDESDDDDRELKGGHESQYYKPQDLYRRHDQNVALAKIEKKALEGQFDEEAEEEGDQYMDMEGEEEGQDALQPGKDDPRLWQVRVKRGLERQVCMSLINKSIDFAKKGHPLAILSATCTENVEGYIYIEAFKEIHIREAIKGLSAVLGNKLELVERAEMTSIYQNTAGAALERQRAQIKKHSWVRIKTGLYFGDLGLVENTGVDSKVWLRVIPRIDLNPQKVAVQSRFTSQRPLPKAFNQDEAKKLEKGGRLEIKKEKDINKTCVLFRRQLFRKGFLYKAFPLKQLEVGVGVRPGVEEVQAFAKIIDENKSGSGKRANTTDADISSGDEANLSGELLIKKTFMLQGSQSEICKGDKIKVVSGDLVGIKGRVTNVEVETGFIIFVTDEIPDFTDELRLEAQNVAKYFEPGDQVRVIDGKYKGETGIVISSETNEENVAFTVIALFQSNREVRILSNHLKLKSEIEQTTIGSTLGSATLFMDKTKAAPYQAGDLINFDNNKNCGVVLSVDSMGGGPSDTIRVINEEGKIVNIRGIQISKRFDSKDFKNRQSAVDAKNNTIYPNNVVRVISGAYQGRKGVIKYIQKGVVFLWDKAFQQTNGIFVEKTRNIEILGNEHMQRSANGQAVAAGSAVANMNKRSFDPLKGKEVFITGGQYKGLRGKVCSIDDRQAVVELSTVCKKIPIDRVHVRDLSEVMKEKNVQSAQNQDDMYTAGGRTIYDGGKTPMQFNTPSHYPHSPHWGAGNSPGFGTEYGGGIGSPGFSRPGSEYHGGGNSTRGASWMMKKEH